MSRLTKFIETTFGEEGSFQNHPKDKGNYYNGVLHGTIWGITARDHFDIYIHCYDLWKKGLIEGSREAAKRFYEESHYWNPLYDEIEDVSLAFRVWDFGINAGVVTSVRLLQKTLAKDYSINIKLDGIFGKITKDAVNRYSNPFIRLYPKLDKIKGETEFYTFYIKRIENYYRFLQGFPTFGIGWISRLKRVFNGMPNLYKPIKHKLVETIPHKFFTLDSASP